VKCAIFVPLSDSPPEYLVRRLKLGLLSPLFAVNQLFAVSEKTDVRRTRFSRDRAVADFVCEATPMEVCVAVFNVHGAIKKEPELVDSSGIQTVKEITKLDSETRQRIWESMNAKITSPERHLVQFFSEAIQAFTTLPQSSAKPEVEENVEAKDGSEPEAEEEAATDSDEDSDLQELDFDGHHMQMAWTPSV